jgi:exopolyphosphatase
VPNTSDRGTPASFLDTLRSRVGSDAVVHVVVGNEAADLDSMASSLMLAWCQSQAHADAVYAPWIPIPRADFKLRTEALYLFAECGVPLEKLLFAEDLDVAALASAHRLRLVLVDHNKLAPALAGLAEAVEEIVDHHADEKLYPQVTQRQIEPVGSAATLVAERILAAGADRLEPASARLLLGTILLDTINLDPQARRVTPRDSAVAEKLVGRCGADRNALFERLQFEKFNVSALDSIDLLRKDYKEYTAHSTRYGMSSVLISAAAWAAKDPHLVAEMARYTRERKLDVLVAMIAYTEPRFTRELLVFSADADLRRRLVDFLMAKDLGLAALAVPGLAPSAELACFAQANESYSRKKLQPLLDGYLREMR